MWELVGHVVSITGDLHKLILLYCITSTAPFVCLLLLPCRLQHVDVPEISKQHSALQYGNGNF